MNTMGSYEEMSEEDILEKFVLQYQPLVKKIALFLKRRLPSHIEFDDLLQSGLLGLLEARKNFDKNSGASFETYASIRIKGAIVDSLRKNSWVTREITKNMRKLSDAISKIEQRNLSHATTEEIIVELGISQDEYFQLSQEISICNVINLDDIENDSSMIVDDEINPREITDRQELKNCLQKVLKDLPEREQLILSLYYMDEFTFRQIGEILDLTEARICQLHCQAIARVRLKMNSL